jgi:tricorn protease
MRKICVFFVLISSACLAQSNPPLLMRKPSISRSEIVFTYGGDLWIVSRDGGDARRLTAGPGTETDPVFSPDGTLVAFTGEYDGNKDVYVIAAAGGEPKRLTYHPGADHVVGWTPDGKRILFTSTRSSYYHLNDKLFTVPVEGGFPSELPLPIAEQGSYSPDGTHLAYVPHPQWQEAWKRYRGGQTSPIWIADLKDSSIQKIPRDNSNDFNPMWVGSTIYFLSDRNGPVSLFAYDTESKRVSEVVKNDGLDFKSASVGPDAIVIEQFAALRLYDLNSHQLKDINIRVAGDFAQVRPHFVKVDPKRIHNFNLSPTGTRALMEAWGEIFTVPAEKGDIRNLTHSPAVADRDPAWSPDGRWVAYFSDEPDEYELQLRDQTGMGKVRHINLGKEPSFYYTPVFSPDSKNIAYSDKRLNLWYVDIEKGTPKLVDTDHFEGPTFSQNWSPDSKWIAYAKQLPSHLHAIYVYSLEQGKSYQVTDGMSDALYPVFDKNGKYLYFTASTDTGLTGSQGWDMSSDNQRVTRSAYVVVLAKDLPSPLAPESDEEKVKQEIKQQKEQQAKDKAKAKDKGKEKEKETNADTDADKSADGKDSDADVDHDKDKKKDGPVVVRIDMEAIGQRILALPIPARNYVNMLGGKTGILFLSEAPPVITEEDQENLKQIIHKFDLKKRKVDKFLDDVNDFTVSANGEKLLYRKDENWALTGTGEPPSATPPEKPKPGEGPLKLDTMEVYVQPREMWNQIYRETWRIQRDFFYDPNHHGLDLAKAQKKYEP